MLEMIAVLFLFQLVGEMIVVGCRLPLPGPVVGMALLFVTLVIRGRMPDKLGDVSRGLLENLSFLFVPAGVGIMAHMGALRTQWPPLAGTLVASAVLTFAVTGAVMQCLVRRPGGSPKARL